MDILAALKAGILGIIEGLTEFLPISSTGHLIIVNKFLKISANANFTTAFEIIIQVGAILAVIVFFWNKIWPFSGTAPEKKDKWVLWGKVIVAVLPAVVLGILFDKFIEEQLFNPITVAVTLIFYGIVFIIIEIYRKRKPLAAVDQKNLTFPKALAIGLCQCLAMIPGTSRSGATIIGGMLLGMSRRAAAEFSFFLAIPTIIGAALFKIIKTGLSFSPFEWLLIGIGFVVSFFVALGVIKAFMTYIQKRDFKIFGWYRIILGALVLLLFIFQVIK